MAVEMKRIEILESGQSRSRCDGEPQWASIADQVRSFVLRDHRFAVGLGLATPADDMAEWARMLAVECLFECGGQSLLLGESDEHTGPGQGLEGNPMTARGDQHC
jgi:hypothetical protein